MAPPKIDIKALFLAIDRPIENESRKVATQIAQTKFTEAKKSFLDSFINDAVSQELLEGSSKTSSEIIQRGNLFGFIGFEEGSDPIGSLYKFLDENITFDKAAVYNRSTKTYNFRIGIPTKNEIKEVTPMPFGTARSWAFAIESGISGLNHYFFKAKAGRSGAGLQLKTKDNHIGQYRPRRYMSYLLNFLEKSLAAK